MSEETGTPKPARGGPGTVLGRVAVGVLLSTPVAALAATTGVEPVAAAPEQVASVCGGPASHTAVSSIREQFQASFTAGAVSPATTELMPIICDR